MRWRTDSIRLGFAAWLTAATLVGAQPTDEQVELAIGQIVERLYSLRNEQGLWDPPQGGGGDYGGRTALATYALLTAGESYQSPRLGPAVEFLKEAPMTGTYAVSIRNHVWANLPTRFEPYLRRDTRWLIEAAGAGPENGAYNYGPSKGGRFDNSVTQYGVLGVWEGAKRGVPIPRDYWVKIEKHFLRLQNDDGGWDYNGGRPSYGSMTAAGLACLFITQEFLHSESYRIPGKTENHPLADPMRRGLNWFDLHFRPDVNPAPSGGAIGDVYYYLVGVERVGLASGYKSFGSKDWYARGAEYLIANPGRDVVQLSFSLLFLVRGRVPLLAGKLQVPFYDWNNRPRDLARLTRWVSDQSEQEVNWQIVNVNTPPHEWLDAPFLYLSGHEPLNLTPSQKDRIKQYIELGGTIVTTSDIASEPFDKSVRELLAEMFPAHPMRRIGEQDELMNILNPIPAADFEAWSVHNGARYLAIHVPREVSYTLHASRFHEIHTWRFFHNLYQFMTENGRPRPRLATHYTPRKAGAPDGPRPRIQVALVQQDGLGLPEPGAWEHLQNAMHNADRTELALQRVTIEDLPLSPAPFAHISGTEPRVFSFQEWVAILSFVQQGGVVLFETVGGRGGFADSAARQLAEALPKHPVFPLNLQSPVVHGRGIGGQDISRITFRPYSALRVGALSTPLLRAVYFEGQPRLLFSDEDLSVALLDRPLWGVHGYTNESAHRIMSNILLWAHSLHGAGNLEDSAQGPPRE